MNIKKTVAVLAMAGTALSAGVLALNAATGKVAFGKWGFDEAAMDKAVKPGDDFFRYVGGTWMKNTPIPADRSRWGSFNILAAKSEEDVKNLVEEIAHKNNPAGSVEQKVADYYNSYLDTAKIDALGMAPFEADLARIANVKTHEEAVALIGEPGFPGNTPVGWFIGLDEKDPDRYAINVGQAGLGMPDRDYYLKPDQKFAETRAAYRAYIEKMLTMAKYANAGAAADAIMATETKIAELSWPIEKLRDRDANYNAKTQVELKAFAPEFPWDAGLAAGDLGAQNFFIVGQPDAIQGLSKLFGNTPVETWRAYLTFHRGSRRWAHPPSK